MNPLHVPRLALTLLLAVAFTVPTLPPVAATGVGTPYPEDVGIDCETENSEALLYGLGSPQLEPKMFPCIDVVSGIACAAGEIEGALETKFGINRGFVEIAVSLTLKGTLASWVHCTGEVRSSAVFYGGVGPRQGWLKVGDTAYDTCTYIAPFGACRTPELSTPYDAWVVRLGVSKDFQFLVCQEYSLLTGAIAGLGMSGEWKPDTECDARNYLSADEGTAHWDLLGALLDDPCSVAPCDPGSVPGPCTTEPIDCEDPVPTVNSLLQTAYGAANLVLQEAGEATESLLGPGGIYECVIGPGQQEQAQEEDDGPLPTFGIETEPGVLEECGKAHLEWAPLP